MNEGVNIRNESTYVLVNDEMDLCKSGIGRYGRMHVMNLLLIIWETYYG